MRQSERARRRSHVKSKEGCLTCRRRHIRCDELRPEWSEQSSHTLNRFSCGFSRNCLRKGSICHFSRSPELSNAPNNDTTRVRTIWEESPGSGSETIADESLPLLKHPSPTESMVDLRMNHHIKEVITALEKSGGHRMAFGIASIPELVLLT